MSDNHEEKKDGDHAPKKKSKKLLFIIVGVVVLLGLGGGAFVMLKPKPPPAEETVEAPKEAEVHLATLKLEPFIVNLSESTSFLKVTLLLEYDSAAVEPKKGEQKGGHGGGGEGEKGPATPAAFAEREPMIRDAVIKVLSSKKSVEVLSPDGKVKLKEDLLEAINEAMALDEPAVTNIYFTEFIIQ